MRVLRLLLVSALLASCGTLPVRSDPAQRPASAGTAPADDRLFVGTPTGLSVVSVATGTTLRELPVGIMSPDGSGYWTVETGATTTVRKTDPTTGGELARMAVPGAFEIPRAYGARADALSASGRYLVLVGADEPSTFAVLDLREGKERARARLSGSYVFDAIDDLGLSLYLLEYPQPGVHRYNVRLWDVAERRLAANAIVDGKSPQPSAADLARGTMGGIHHATATAGQWHLGLYLSTTKGPVVHALNMHARFAFCLIELSGYPEHRAGWSIVAAPNGHRAFAVNAASGAFAAIDTQSLQMATRKFSVGPGPETDLRGSAVVSPDGARLYATGGRGLLVVDAHTLSMKGQWLAGRELRSVMVSPDGTRLYVLDRDGTISRIEPGSGRDLGVVARLPGAVSLVRLD